MPHKLIGLILIVFATSLADEQRQEVPTSSPWKPPKANQPKRARLAYWSNVRFAGHAEIYLGHNDLAKMAEDLRGFPARTDDSREFELGTFNPKHADGGICMRFYCTGFGGPRCSGREAQGRCLQSFG